MDSVQIKCNLTCFARKREGTNFQHWYRGRSGDGRINILFPHPPITSNAIGGSTWMAQPQHVLPMHSEKPSCSPWFSYWYFFWHWVWHPNLEITGGDIITINFQWMALPIGGPCKMLRIIGFNISNYYLWDSDLTSPGDSQPNAIPSESCTRNLVCSYPEVNSRSLHSPVHLWLQGNRLAHVHPGDPLERKIKIK